MKFKTLLMSMLLFVAAFQLSGQIGPNDEKPTDGEKPCATFADVKQVCEKDGTVTINYRIANNTRCDASAISIIPDNGFGQSFPVGVNGQTVSGTVFTYSDALPGSTICIEVILHGKDGRECCRTKICLKVTEKCCDLKAKVYKVTCEPNAYAHIGIGGGTAPYTGPGFTNGNGEFWVTGLSAGTHTFTYMDANGCEIDVTVVVQSEKCCGFDAELLYSKGCPPNAEASIHVTGGTPPYSGPGNQNALGYFYVTGLGVGPQVLEYTDANGCVVMVTFEIELCCELKGELTGLKGCPPNVTASIYITNGTWPYTGPGTQVALGAFQVDGLDSGPQSLLYTDANGCTVDVNFVVPENDLDVSLTNSNGCGTNGSAQFTVTGGTPPYSSGSQTNNTGNFGFFNLSSGTHTFTFTDANGCSVTESVTIAGTSLQATVMSVTNATCGNNNGRVTIQVTGGSSPYFTSSQAVNVFSNVWEATGLPPGDYTYTFFDSANCATQVSFTIELQGADCSDFLAIVADESNANTITVTSSVTATLTVLLEALCVPDQVIITVNNNEVVNITAGNDDCDGNNMCDNNPSNGCAEFCVEPCDVVVFTFFGDICQDDCFNGQQVGTAWDFSVTSCDLGCGNGGSRIVTDSGSDFHKLKSRNRINREEANAMSLLATESLKLYPNPVTDILTVTYSNENFEYHTARVFNAAGSVLHTQKMNGKDQLQIDASTFPQGIYMIELTDNIGNRVIEKFSKMD